jgi:hypothetical protein
VSFGNSTSQLFLLKSLTPAEAAFATEILKGDGCRAAAQRCGITMRYNKVSGSENREYVSFRTASRADDRAAAVRVPHRTDNLTKMPSITQSRVPAAALRRKPIPGAARPDDFP